MKPAARLFVSFALLASLALPVRAAEKIKLLYPPLAIFAGAYVAEDQGYSAKHGLEVEFTVAQNSSTIPAALVAEPDTIGGFTPTVLLQANEQGLDLAIVAGTNVATDQPSIGQGVLARTGSGLKGPRDLVGRKVGDPGFGGYLDLIARKWVRLAGADDRKVDWVEIPYPRMQDALASGLVDAVVLTAPFYQRIVDAKVGYDIGNMAGVVPPGAGTIVYSATRGWAEAHIPAIRAFRAALDEANKFLSAPENIATVREPREIHAPAAPSGRGARDPRRTRCNAQSQESGFLDRHLAGARLDQDAARPGEADRAISPIPMTALLLRLGRRA